MELFAATPCILRETSAGVFTYRIADEMLRDREVELAGPIDSELANSLIRQLRHLQKEDADTEITMFVNSPGGEVSSGLALYDAMRAVSCPVRTVCLGMAASMAALIFIAGDERDMLPHSRLMVHDPLIAGGGLAGPALSVKASADDLMRMRDITAQIISRHSGMPVEEVFELTSRDTYLEAEDAIARNFADRVADRL